MSSILRESESFKNAARQEAKLAVNSRHRMLDHLGSWTAKDFIEAEPDDWKYTSLRDNYTSAEVQIGKRCHGFHMELMNLDITPTTSHYKLIHYDVPVLDPATHQVKVEGMVEKELSLSVEDIKRRPNQQTHAVLMACAGTGRSLQSYRLWTHAPWGPDSIGCSEWAGVPLADVLKEAGLKDGSSQVIFTGADKGVEGGEVQYFQRSLTLEEATRGHVLLVYAMNGEDLTPAHGAPVRIIVPGWYGMASVKWLTSIKVVSGGWWGAQMDAYSYKRFSRDPDAVPMQQLPVRALMAPPGFPDFVSRTRIIPPGLCRIVGKAWSGAVDLDRVEFSSDNGFTWENAVLEEKNGSFGWASWHFEWQATEGTAAVLMCRAFDCKGRSQDLPGDDRCFNYGSFGCTQPQQVFVKVNKLINSPGSRIDLTSEQKAAKANLQEASGLKKEFVDALYQAPGSQ
jgi:DMSO/TMAO reductase YedYZ molybdopterin-dependent catalytic subunit